MGITFSNEIRLGSKKILATPASINEYLEVFCVKLSRAQKAMVKRQLNFLINNRNEETVYVFSERTSYTLNGVDGYNGSIVIAYSFKRLPPPRNNNGVVDEYIDLSFYSSHADSYWIEGIFGGVKHRIKGIDGLDGNNIIIIA